MADEAWLVAFELLSEADWSEELDVDALEMLADAAYLAGRPDASRRAAGRLYLTHLAAGHSQAAAGAAVRIAGSLLGDGLVSPLRGWTSRARMLLEASPDSAIHGALASVMMWAAIASGDGETALAEARRAIEIGTAAGDSATRALGLNGEGRALILLGRVEEGLELLEESTVGAMSGELSAISAAALYCSTVCALQALAQYERAEEWTRVMEGWVEDRAVGPFRGWCRVHKAEVLRLRGLWPDAEDEAQRALEEVRPFGGIDVGWPLTEIANVRLRSGDLEGAEQAFLQARELGWEPQPGLALLRLAQGNVENAVADVRDALDHPPQFTGWERPPNTELRRAPLLAAQVEIAVAAGDLECAVGAAAELDVIADTLRTPAIRGLAAVARGTAELAEGDTEAARSSLETGVSLWTQIGAPYESAQARLRLAAVHRACGDTTLSGSEYRTALTILDRLGATLDVREASQALAEITRQGSVNPSVEKVFMFTDIVGSTNLVEVIGDDAWRHLVRWHNQMLSSLFRAHAGEIVRTTGDGFLVTFDSGVDAVACAVAVQRALEEHRRVHGFAPQVRIGVHAARATRDGNDWSGVGVHVAARISALADPAEILVSADTAAAVGAGWMVSEPKVLHLKGVSRGCEVVAIDWR